MTDPPAAVEAGPPWVLNERTVEVGWPPAEPAVVAVSLPPRAAIGVLWPRCRVSGAALPPPPRVIRLAARPQGPWRLPFPQGHPLRNPNLYARI